MRRGASVVLVAAGVLLLLGSYVGYTQRVVTQLRREAQRSARMYAQVYRGIASGDPVGVLYDLARQIGEAGVPVVVTDASGAPAAHQNLPDIARETSPDDPRVREWVARLDAQNPPVVEPGVGTVHFGNPPIVRGLRVIPLLQAGMLVFLIGAGIYALRTREHARQERVWVGMARESAHQLGTPLSSLSGWLELLRDREGDPLLEKTVAHMGTDLERLERVAHRFERIGRPPKLAPVDAGTVVERIAAYFSARVPTLAHTVRIAVKRSDDDLTVRADEVLLDWALEAITKNAVDALAGRGGRILMAVERTSDGRVRIRVSDDGPGVPREMRSRIFEPGFSTKESGWGVGLSLTRRIVEDAHGGRVALVPSDRGAVFDVILS